MLAIAWPNKASQSRFDFAGQHQVEKAPADRLRHADRIRVGQHDDAEVLGRQHVDAGRGAEIERAGMAPADAALLVVADVPAEPIERRVVDHRVRRRRDDDLRAMGLVQRRRLDDLAPVDGAAGRAAGAATAPGRAPRSSRRRPAIAHRARGCIWRSIWPRSCCGRGPAPGSAPPGNPQAASSCCACRAAGRAVPPTAPPMTWPAGLGRRHRRRGQAEIGVGIVRAEARGRHD